MTTTRPGTDHSSPPGDAWQDILEDTLELIRKRPEVAAQCRRGLGKKPLDVPFMWDHCIPVADAASPQLRIKHAVAEETAHHVLTLYAVHQQSRDEPMNRRGQQNGPRSAVASRSVGHAAGQLYLLRDTDGTRRRFLATATASGITELAGHLRHLVPQFREEAIPLDYLALFKDIASWTRPQQRHRVRQSWGLDYQRTTRHGKSGNDAKEQNQ